MQGVYVPASSASMLCWVHTRKLVSGRGLCTCFPFFVAWSPMIWSATILRSVPVKKNGNGRLNSSKIFKTSSCREMISPTVRSSVPVADAESGKGQSNCWWNPRNTGAWVTLKIPVNMHVINTFTFPALFNSGTLNVLALSSGSCLEDLERWFFSKAVRTVSEWMLVCQYVFSIFSGAIVRFPSVLAIEWRFIHHAILDGKR